MNKDKEISRIEECIAQLVYDKTALRKAYNYYHGVRDAEQFRHLEENYGIGVPTSVIFNPLMKKHIDVLVGEYLELDPDMKVTCKDEETISKIQRDKKIKIDSEMQKFCIKYLKNAVISILLGEKQPMNDPFFEKELERIKTNIENSFESDFEIAGQNIIEYIKYSRDLDIKNKLREIIIDLLVGGCCYYRVKPSGDNENMRVDVLNPLDTFIERNPHKFFLNKSRRAVIRRYLTKEEVFEEFGEELPSGAVEKLDNYFYEGHRDFEEGEFVVVPTSVSNDIIDSGNVQKGPTPGILAGLEVTPIYPYNDDFG